MHIQDEEKQRLLGRPSSDSYRPIVPQTTCGMKRNLANILTMAVGYLLVFSAFQTTQMLASKLLGDLGSYSLTLIYAFFTAGGFIAPAVVSSLPSPKVGLALGAAAYAIYVGSLVYLITPLVLVCSAIIGIGAAVLWCSQGVIMSLNTNETNDGQYNSLFWGIFNLCVLPGNIVGHFLLAKKSSTPTPDTDPCAAAAGAGATQGWNSTNSPLFFVLTVAAVVGIMFFFFIRKPDASDGGVAKIEKRPVMTQIKSTFAAMFLPRMLCMLPIFAYTGVGMSMWASWFTRQMYATEVGLVMIGFGLAEFIGGFMFGKIIDYSRNLGLFLGTCFAAAAMILTVQGNNKVISMCAGDYGSGSGMGMGPNEVVPPCLDADYTTFYIAAVLYGFMDCIIQTLCASICGKDFESTGNTPDAWALFRTFQAAGAFVCFLVSPSLASCAGTTSTKEQLFTEILITAAVGVLAILGYFAYNVVSSSSGKLADERLVAENEELKRELAATKARLAALSR